ncbi:MAG TPA: DUF3108 domain-containing protein [Blastocatellia bacterium]|nr:DUF3108 domain-containing protein [Blastocatellia bacterium]
MTKSIRAVLSGMLGAVAVLSVVGGAQVTSERQPGPIAPPSVYSKVVQPLPFKPGEILVYEVSFSKLIFSGIVGDVKLAVSKPAGPTPNLLEFKAEAVSRGFFPALLGLKVKDTYSSAVNEIDLGLQSYKRLIEEGKKRREQTSVINRDSGRVTYSDRDLSKAGAPPTIKEAPSPPWIQDVLSAIYFVRAHKLKEGDVIPVAISDGGEVYNVEVVVGKREGVKLALGQFRTVRLDAKVFDGRFLRRSGEMLVWISDDPRRLIVRARIKTAGATVTAELKRISHSENIPAARPSG